MVQVTSLDWLYQQQQQKNAQHILLSVKTASQTDLQNYMAFIQAYNAPVLGHFGKQNMKMFYLGGLTNSKGTWMKSFQQPHEQKVASIFFISKEKQSNGSY